MGQKALNSRLGRADNTRFLEQFRYIIVASQLLSEHLYQGHPGDTGPVHETESPIAAPHLGRFTLTGAIITAASAFGLAWVIHWARGDQNSNASSGRVIVVVILFVALAILGYAYVRRQWLQYLRQQTLTEASKFVAKAQRLDVAISASVALIQEVELVSRGYRMCV